LSKLIKEDFLKEYHLNEQMLAENNISWEMLKDIHSHFVETREALITQADFIANTLRSNNHIHTVRSRVKDPEHLIAKLIRKTATRKETKGNDFQFTVDNYQDEITDLIGVRAIHIFKEEWESIHQFITSTWKVIETTANVREGDDTRKFNELNITIDSRNTGYRSVHYLIEFHPTNKRVVAEIQVRTIFEEGYGEIDHQLRYPHGQVPEVLALNLLLFNRIVGSADEMASFINILKKNWTATEERYESIIKDKNDEIEKLKSKVRKANMKAGDKQVIMSGLDGIITNNNSIIGIGNPKVNFAGYDSLVKSISGEITGSVFNTSNYNNVISSVINPEYFKNASITGAQIKVNDPKDSKKK